MQAQKNTSPQLPSMFTSALIQSEQVGAGLAESLRGQSADHWNRRRERALMEAQALPARLSIPLVVCFLPSLFIITLGPILLDFIKLAATQFQLSVTP